MPSTLALISNLFVDPRQRALGIGIWATMWGVGSALGPVVGGLMLEWFWWGAAFLLVVPVVALLVLLGPFVLPEYRSPRAERLDLLSVLLSLAAALPFVYGLKQVAKEGLVSSAVMATIVGVLFAWLFVRRQRRLTDPLLDLSLFRPRLLRGACRAAFRSGRGWRHHVARRAVPATGSWILTFGCRSVDGIGRVGDDHRWYWCSARCPSDPSRLCRCGALALSAAGYLLLSQVTDATSGVLMAVASLALAYLGNGTIAALGTDLVVGAAPAEGRVGLGHDRDGARPRDIVRHRVARQHRRGGLSTNHYALALRRADRRHARGSGGQPLGRVVSRRTFVAGAGCSSTSRIRERCSRRSLVQRCERCRAGGCFSGCAAPSAFQWGRDGR